MRTIGRVSRTIATGLMTALLAVVLGGGLALAQDDKPSKPETRKVQSIGRDFYDNLQAILEQIELKQYAEAKQNLDRLQRDEDLNNAERATIFQTFAQWYAGQDDYRGAARMFELALQEGAQGGMSEGQMLSVRYNLGQLYLATEQFQLALRNLTMWYQQAENPAPSAMVVVAQAYYRVEDFDRALTLVREGIDKANARAAEALTPEERQKALPQRSWYEFLLALYFEKENYPAAGSLLEVMLQRFPTQCPYWKQLGAIYGELRREEDAFHMLHLVKAMNCLEKSDEYVRLAQNYAFYETPMRCARLMTEGIADKIVERDSDNYRLLADCLTTAREFDDAIPPLTQAAKQSDEGELYFRLGQVYLEREDWEKAEDSLEGALKKGGLHGQNEGRANLLLGIARINQNKFDSARRALRDATKEKKFADQARRWMQFIDESTGKS